MVKRPDNATFLRSREATSVGLIALLMASAYLMALAIESPCYWWLGWFTLVPLLLAVRVFIPIAAMFSGALWGASLYVFAVALTDTAVSPSMGSFALLAIIPAAYAFLAARLTRRVGFSPLLLGLGWIGVEFALRPLGLRHGLLASTQGDGLVIRVVGSFAGYALVAFIVAYVNASLISVLSRVHRGLSGARYVSGTGACAVRFFILDVPSYLAGLIRPAQPRAPPV